MAWRQQPAYRTARGSLLTKGASSQKGPVTSMQYKPFKDNLSLSTLGMGNMRLPVQRLGTKIDRPKAGEIIDYAMANGINYYDTAYVYHFGESEKFLGEALKKYPRESYHLATKYYMMATKNYKKVFEEQLKRLQTDYIDFYLIHCIMDVTWKRYINSGCIEYFLEQKAKGRIKYLGFSSHAGVEALSSFADYTKWDFAQIQLNYFDWFYGNTRKEYKALEERGLPIIVMEPVRGGKLASLNKEAEALLKEAHPDWSIASWALRFVKSLPQVQVVLSGMSTLSQIQDNVATFEEEGGLTEKDKEILLQACELFHGQFKIPCTACHYCLGECPKEIRIPAYLDLYNAYKAGEPGALRQLGQVDSKGTPADCIGCGKCRSHCPQSIEIPQIMKELAQAAPDRE